ncbi:hypothetical protein SAMN06295987_109101 [Novosphingobium mathurense]|uniref:Ribbon-helix-helix protein, copG family n=1 Tax=Novosphingobium mathurense TaxID=428990 RepID=A0A1U6IME2_9SPHN|nr:hypothetical protein SAMN06295987_109101 [Novosphingobium mathurense]
MNRTSVNQQIGVRMPADLVALVDRVAHLKNCDRPQAIREIIAFGAPLLIEGRGVNLSRVLFTLEILVEDCIKRTLTGGQDDLTTLLKSAQRNVEQHHV